MPSLVEIGPPVPEKIFERFLPYGHGGHLGHVTGLFINTLIRPFLWMLHIKFGFDWPRGFREEDV